VTPAPVWRRLAALAYDSLLLAALWMVAAMAVTVVNQLLPVANGRGLMRLAMFLVGLAFFGWFWARGGQTLGMRAWRLRVQRRDGTPLPLTHAAWRYLIAVLPVVATLYAVARFGRIGLLLAVAGYLPCLVDGRRRAFHDLLSGSEVLLLPRRSAQAAQSPEGDQHQQESRQHGG
jgi:uncharacterized RDD family membrane protein YckC